MPYYLRWLLPFLLVLSISTYTEAQTTLFTLPLSVTAACPGSTVAVSYSVTGPYTTSTVFTVQVSDGGEYRDIIMGQKPNEYGSTLYVRMPTDLTTEVTYTFRVRATNPDIIGTASPTTLRLKGNSPKPAPPRVDSLVVTCQSFSTGSDAAHYAFVNVYTALGATPRLYYSNPVDSFTEEFEHYCVETPECRRGGTFNINKVGFYSYNYVYPVNERTFYVSQLLDGCESERVPVIVRILFTPGSGPTLPNSTDGPKKFGRLAYCQGDQSYPLNVNGHGSPPENYRVVYYGVSQFGYPDFNTGTFVPPVPDTSLPNHRSYILSYVPIDPGKGCAPQNSSLFPTLTVTVDPKPTKPTAITSVINYYQGQPSIPLSAIMTDSTASLVWYGTNATGGTGSAIAPQPPTSQVGQFTYYVAQKIGGCAGERVPIQVVVNPLLGVDDPSLAQAVDIFPNPAVSSLTVRIRGLSTHQPAQLTLIDLKGQVILQQETQQETSVLTLDDYPKGSYLLLINVGNRRASRRVVKL